VIIDLVDAEWHFTAGRAEVEVLLEAEGRRFVARLRDTDMPAFERLLEALPRSRPVDLAQESAKILGRNPFVEHQDPRR
jgi:hypothetical protein